MVAFAEPSRPQRRAYAQECVGSFPCASGKNPSLGVDRNQQYSITALTNASGTIVERYAYSAYGQPTITDGSGTALTSSPENNRYTYTGREWDEDLHLYHYRARMYDAVSGRFLGRDPIGFEGSPWNVYEYVKAGPSRRNDPSGLGWKDLWDIICRRKPTPKTEEHESCLEICDGMMEAGIIRHNCIKMCDELLYKSKEFSYKSLTYRCRLKIKTSPRKKFWIEACAGLCEGMGCGNKGKCLEIFKP